MFYVYVLKSEKDKRHYISFSTDLKLRYKEHCDGKVRATFYRRPLVSVYYEAYSSREIAQKRERQLKSGKDHMALIERLKIKNE